MMINDKISKHKYIEDNLFVRKHVEFSQIYILFRSNAFETNNLACTYFFEFIYLSIE